MVYFIMDLTFDIKKALSSGLRPTETDTPNNINSIKAELTINLRNP